MHRLTDRLIERLRRLPLDRFETLGRGDLMTRLTGDTQRIVNATPALIGGPMALLRRSFGALFAMSVQPQIAGVAAGAMILVGLAIAAQMQVMSRGFAHMAGDEMRLYDLLRGHVAGAIPMKLPGARSAAIGRAFTAVSDGMRDVRVGILAVFFERQHAANAVLYGILGVNVFLLLRFHYPSTPERPGFGVGPIDLSFERRRIIFITGFNGSGKSTFLKMLTGLYPAEAATVTPAQAEAAAKTWAAVYVVLMHRGCISTT